MADKKTKKGKKETKSASKNVQKIVNEVAKLSVLELSELVSALQDKLGVSAAPVAAPIAAPAGEAPAEDKQSGETAKQTLTMTAAGDSKISVIKALKEINPNWGLKEAKDMTENLPAEVLKDAKAEEAKEAAGKLKAAGATVEVK